MRTILNKRIVKILFIGLWDICSSTNALHAINHGICGDSIKWTLKHSKLTFYGSGQMEDFGGFRPWREKSVDTVVINEGITNIGNRAFEECVYLKQISIPNSVKTIGDSAFNNCKDLQTIILPNSVVKIGNGCFSGCENLRSIVLSDSLRYIGLKTFYECKSLTNIIIPNSVQYIGSNTFLGCNELAILIVPDEPFEVCEDTVLGLASCHKLSIIRAHHSLCPDYMLKYIPAQCLFMREGNPRRYYAGSITDHGRVIVPAIKTYTKQEAIDTIDCIFNKHFSLADPCSSYYLTQEEILKYITVLERPMYKEVLQHYYDEFYEAGSNNDLGAATLNAFKHIILGGKEDEDFMWDIIITKYGSENETNNTRFLMSMFNEVSLMRDNAYQHTIDSLTMLYFDVLYPSPLMEMCGYWVSVNDTTEDGNLTEVPDYIINIADITCPTGTIILSAPQCEWSSKKKKNQWQNKTHDDKQLRYSYHIGYNEGTQKLQLRFSDQSKKIANTKVQHQALDMVQDFEATMSASLEQIQKELNRGLSNNWISFGGWSANTAIGFGIALGVQVVTTAVVFAILYASNIETAQAYDIWLTQQAPDVLDVSVKYTYVRYNYNNGDTKQKEEQKNLTFVRWEENDSVIFISNKGIPIFIGEELPANSPLLKEYNANKKKSAYQKINNNNMSKMRQKAENMLLLQEQKDVTYKEQSNNEDNEYKELFY